jgi:hypothetical protein
MSAPGPKYNRACAVDADLVTLYCEETGQSERIVRAFLAHDVEPPPADATRTNGFSSKQSKMLDDTAPAMDSGNDL